jgi:hypothetical protein
VASAFSSQSGARTRTATPRAAAAIRACWIGTSPRFSLETTRELSADSTNAARRCSELTGLHARYGLLSVGVFAVLFCAFTRSASNTARNSLTTPAFVVTTA